MKNKIDNILEIYKLSFEISDIPLCIVDSDGMIINQNNASRLQLGMPKNNNQYFTPASISPERQPDGRLSSEKSLEMIKIAFESGHHSFDWIHNNELHENFSARVTLDRILHAGELYLLVTVQDLSEIKKIERIVHEKTSELANSRQDFKDIFDNSFVANLVVNADRVLTMANDRAAAILEYSVDELIGMKTTELYMTEKDYLEFGDKYYPEIQKNGFVQFDYSFRKKNGKAVWCSVSGSPLGNNHVLWVAQDITERIELEKKLEDLYILAKDANPITGLPGNRVIETEIKKVILNNEATCVIYADLDNFKSYNDKYGFAKGDEVIEFTSSVLGELEEKLKLNSFFLGHIGGDDFVMIVPESEINRVEQYIVERFDTGIRRFYEESDLSSGQIISTDRLGMRRKYPIMGLSLAGVLIKDRSYTSYLEVVDICTATKRRAKQFVSTCLVIDERRG